ncbi:MAG: imidazole glycerol phosphate synthase cyclase subunit [Cytophagales bacterium CG12_big_fil_rev_8_21_14_0_65_40_12]|nr:MAG: imidazole glycerol phosphate synthase cyclase subunit [Cytophagales bacterium CG12_big_fil_rev_8_21_14_0_65_40_12]
MLKLRIIPILTFNGFALVKTKQFGNPRMVGNPVQTARVYNARGVDELVFLDIFASTQQRKLNLKLIGDVIKECFMPVAIGGGINTLEDINDLLQIGADKVVIKAKALSDALFIKEAVRFFGSQCISIAIDASPSEGKYFIKQNEAKELISVGDFIDQMEDCDVGEYILNATHHDGMMNGFDLDLINFVSGLTNKPIVAVGGAGNPAHFVTLFTNTTVEAVGSASIYHFTQYTPLDVKLELKKNGFPVRL